MKINTLTAACAGALAAWPAADAFSQEIADTVVVTATRVERPTFDLPLSIDCVGAARIREHQAGVNISESLNRVPGTVVQNRYAQEQQITIRGFGARSQFGVRGVKLLADGIPASTADGQGGSGLQVLRPPRQLCGGLLTSGVQTTERPFPMPTNMPSRPGGDVRRASARTAAA